MTENTRWQWLKERLKEMGCTPTKFSRIIEWESQRVFELFNGRTKALPSSKINKAAEYLGVDLKSLISFNGNLTNEIIYINKEKSVRESASDGISLQELDKSIEIVIFVTDKIEKWLEANKKSFTFSDEEKKKLIKAICLKVQTLPTIEEKLICINQFLDVNAMMKKVE